MRTVLLLCALCVLCVQYAAAASAMPVPGPAADLQARAEAGDGRAAYRLGLALRNGEGVPASAQAARRWLETAAAAGVPAAMFTLSNMLADGEGGPADLAGARRWLEAAATLDYPEALQQLALGEQDPARAALLMRQAAHAMTHRRQD